MTDRHAFEPGLERRLVALAAQASRPFDAGEVARAAIDAAPPRGGAMHPARRRFVLALLGALLLVGLVVSGALVAGSLLFREAVQPRPTPLTGTLAIGTATGFVFADPDGGHARVIDARGPFFEPAWSPDGTTVAVTAILPEDPNALLVYDATGSLVGSATRLAPPLRWSPDGRWLLAAEIPGPGLRLVAARTGDVAPDVPLPEGVLGITGADWLPDGRIVAGVQLAGEEDDAHGLWILDPVAGTATRMPGDAGRNGFSPAVRPDGRQVAFGVSCGVAPACEPLVRIADAASGARRAEVESARLYDRPRWAPDGRGLAYSYTLQDGRIVVDWWDLAGEVTHVDPWSTGNTIAAEVLPGRAGILVLHQSVDGNLALWRLPLDGAAPVELVPDAYGAALQPAVVEAPDAGATPFPSAGAWVPPGWAGTIPAAVEDRDVVPFCGVDGGGVADPARQCLADALAAGAVVELATDRETAEGWRLSTILRTTPAGGADITSLTDPAAAPPAWERQSCGRVVVRTDGVEIGECGELTRLE